QGLTGAAGIVIARASARDMYAGKDLTQFIALLAIVNGAAPILAPIFGGIILKWMTWKAVFYVLSIIGLVMFLTVLIFLPETLPKEKRMDGNVFAMYKSFGTLFKDRIFLGISFGQSFISMAMFAYIAASPFVLQNIYHISPQQFSIIFAVNGLGILIAAQVSGRLMHNIVVMTILIIFISLAMFAYFAASPFVLLNIYHISPQQFSIIFAVNGLGIVIAAQVAGRLTHHFAEMTILHIGITMAFIGSVLLMFVVFVNLALWVIIIALFMVVSSVGLVNTTSFSLAMNRQGKIAGSASAFLGVLPFAG